MQPSETLRDSKMDVTARPPDTAHDSHMSIRLSIMSTKHYIPPSQAESERKTTPLRPTAIPTTFAAALACLPSGERFATSLSSPDGRIPQLEEPVSLSIERLRLTGDEFVTDTIADAWLPPEPGAGGSVAPGAVSLGLPDKLELSPGLHWGVLPDGTVAFADSSTYAIKIAAAVPTTSGVKIASSAASS